MRWFLLFITIVLASPYSFAKPTNTMDELITEIHKEAILIDGHNDLAWQLRDKKDFDVTKFDLSKPQKDFHTDIPRLQKGGVGAQFWSAYVPTSTVQQGTAVTDTLEQIALIHTMVKRYPDIFEMAYSTEDIRRIRKQGKIASLIGVEGGHSINNSLGVLRAYYNLGVRYLTLTHNDNTDWADSATDQPKHSGLNELGTKIVAEMNRLGMIIDISHVSVDTMKDVFATSKAPVIASHSSSYTISPHPRNIPDDVLKQLAQNDGVVMVNFGSFLLTPEAAKTSVLYYSAMSDFKKKNKDKGREAIKAFYKKWVKDHPIPKGSVKYVADHIDQIVRVAGINHVGLGADFDGVSTLPDGLTDVSTYPNLTRELLKRGYKKEDILKILGGNLLRVMERIETVSKKIQ